MKRVIVDYKKLTPDIMVLLAKEYRLGIESSDIITFKNSENETVDAVEVKSEDTIYLVKVGVKLDKALKNFISGGYEFDMDIHFSNY
jgi:DNA-directed RNA polymerase subunit delta